MPIGAASTCVIYTGITAATGINGTGSTTLNLAGQYQADGTTGEQGTGWNRHLGANFKINQTTTSLVRGASVYTSRSNKEYNLFTWNSTGATYQFASVADLITASHTGIEAIDFVSSTEEIRVPGFSHEPKPLHAFLSQTLATGDASDVCVPVSSVLPPSLGAIGSESWSRYIIVLPYDTTTAITYVVTSEFVNETARFTPSTTAGAMDSVYTVVPNRNWTADPVAVARDRNAFARGNASTTGYKLNPHDIMRYLGKAYRVGRQAHSMYRSFQGHGRSRIGGPTNLGLIGAGAGATITEVPDDYILP